MQQHELRPPKGATHRKKRVGRGNASGHGTYSTRGMKGQKARAGGGVRPGFEGGQLPLVRRMARKRGFRNYFRVDYEEVNVGRLARFGAGDEVTADTLRAARLVQSQKPIKVLGSGDLTVALTVEASSFSKSAVAKIEAAGGTVRWLNGKPAEPETPSPAATAAAPSADDSPARDGAPAEVKPKRQRKPRAEASTAADDAAQSAAPAAESASPPDEEGA